MRACVFNQERVGMEPDQQDDGQEKVVAVVCYVVMCVFSDLPGRGYSEICSKTPQNMQLYAALILMVATSSTAPGSFLPFNLLGYSLGGGICVSFAAQFPHLVSSIAVFSSGGLLPYSLAPFGMKCSLFPWVPVWLADKLLTTKLKGEEEGVVAEVPLGDDLDDMMKKPGRVRSNRTPPRNLSSTLSTTSSISPTPSLRLISSLSITTHLTCA